MSTCASWAGGAGDFEYDLAIVGSGGAVEEVIALEPEPYLRARADEAARKAAVPVSVRNAVAEELPLDAIGVATHRLRD